MKELPAFERQLLLARVYHFSWYSDEAYAELLEYINRWEGKCEIKATFFEPLEKQTEAV